MHGRAIAVDERDAQLSLRSTARPRFHEWVFIWLAFLPGVTEALSMRSEGEGEPLGFLREKKKLRPGGVFLMFTKSGRRVF